MQTNTPLIFHNIQTSTDVEKAFPIIKELRSHLTYEEFLHLYKLAKAEHNYTLVMVLQKNSQVEIPVAVFGYRIYTDFIHKRHLYIDDLVTTAEFRSKGIGAKVLNYAETLAKELHCHGMRLCTGIDNEDGKKFYEKNNWDLRAVAYKKKIL